MNDVYLISTLKTDWNLAFNSKLCRALEERGFRIYLPQRDTNQKAALEEIFRQNVSAIRNSHASLFVVRNESVNCCAEVGLAFGIQKPVLALCGTDHDAPVMTRGMLTHAVRVTSLDDLPAYLDDLVSALKRFPGSRDVL